MRDRLIELIIASVKGCARNWAEVIADYLLENGVIVPPVKIGQEMWDIYYNKPRKWEVVYLGYNGKDWFINVYWFKDRHNFKTMQIDYSLMGKMWYFSREEAEAKLKEGVQG